MVRAGSRGYLPTFLLGILIGMIDYCQGYIRLHIAGKDEDSTHRVSKAVIPTCATKEPQTRSHRKPEVSTEGQDTVPLASYSSLPVGVEQRNNNTRGTF